MQTTRVATGRLRRRAAAAFLVTALGVAGGGPAHGAEPKAGSKEAKHAEAVAHFEKGKKLGEIGRYEDSVKEFEESYLLEPVPEILLNIALSHRFMKHYDKAIELYGRYIKMRPDAPNRKEIEK
ncbi:MAG TPA: hypothetical protein VG389_21090, partial [Myxococcota bacterium]|nr:hypothetical protein [Myxococcota bacterium]